MYRDQAKLPSVRADLYQTICDFLLSSWDSWRGISERQNLLDIRSVHNLLETVAFDAFNDSKYLFPISDLRSALARQFETTGHSSDLIDPVIDQLLSSGILVKNNTDSVEFVHLTFMEFYAAKRLIQTPRRFGELLIGSAPAAKEIILFAAGMILDVSPLVESAVDRHELILAANCLREGRTENRALETYVLDQLKRELGSEFIRNLAESLTQERRPRPESIHSILSRQYSEIRDPELKSHEKGKRFEEFAVRFFCQSFHVVDSNRNTENGEIDIILENTGADPFWFEYGGDIFVECKNWDKSSPLKETAAFVNKVRMSRVRLGFFVSVSGFTENALRTLKNLVADKDAPLIVPISGEEIELMLEHREKFDLFFKDSIRKIKHLHKW